MRGQGARIDEQILQTVFPHALTLTDIPIVYLVFFNLFLSICLSPLRPELSEAGIVHLYQPHPARILRPASYILRSTFCNLRVLVMVSVGDRKRLTRQTLLPA